MSKGRLCFVLHAHLPFVPCQRHQALEERWLFEAITESYVPLLMAMESWQWDALQWQLTLSVSPTLAAMLKSERVQQRYLSHLTNLIALARQEQVRLQGNSDFYLLALYYEQRFESIRNTWLKYDGDLTQAFAAFSREGSLELITTAATHAFLPYVLTDQAVHVQLATALQSHYDVFSQHPRGMWLPECAYRPGIDELLCQFGIRYSFVDTHALRNANPRALQDIFAPVRTKAGVYWFARDPETAREVWSSHGGYPGDPDYREYYRDIGYDLPYEYIQPYLTDGIRTDTGLKYFRVTGGHSDKVPYHPEVAQQKANEHARDFLRKRRDRVARLCETTGHPPFITCMYDAELFGHWWYEGPEFLNQLVRVMQTEADGIQLSTPGAEAERIQEHAQQVELEMSSWGRGGYGEVWLNEQNDEMYRTLHRLEREMIALAGENPAPHELERRMLNQAAREILLAQSSDWAFIKDNNSAVQYADNRFRGHVRAFDDLAEMIRQRNWNLHRLIRLERSDNLFPNMDYSLYQNQMPQPSGLDNTRYLPFGPLDSKREKPRVLMLSWEYPPEQVGGLARHVHHLAVAMASANWEVHVLTRHTAGMPFHEVSKGVHVHRVVVKEPHGRFFLDWVFQMNLGMVQMFQQAGRCGGMFDVLHAHDWLVAEASLAIHSITGRPLVTTVHATEHGRNQGIRTDLQRQIHEQEGNLVAQSDAVIVCSRFMKDEVERIHSVHGTPLVVIPNGVTMTDGLRARDDGDSNCGKTVFFVGRMVTEKGVDVLLRAVRTVLDSHPGTRFVLAGTGPMYEVWQEWGHQISAQIEFIGFVTDEVRDERMRQADVCVFPSLYEPFGIVALEAMAMGTPVVVSATGGMREVVTHGVTGCTFEPGNPISLANEIVKVLSNPKFAQTLVQNARQSALNDYAWSAIARRTTEVYLRLLEPTRQKEEVGVQ